VICMAQGSVKTGQLFTKADRAKAFVIKVTGQLPSSIALLILYVRPRAVSCTHI
jgi:hypothetical protein